MAFTKPPPASPPVPPANRAAPALTPAAKSYKGMAIGSLACGIVSLLVAGLIVGPVAVILGVIARKGMRDSNNLDGYGIAIAGVITGATGAALAVAIIVVAVVARSS